MIIFKHGNMLAIMKVFYLYIEKNAKLLNKQTIYFNVKFKLHSVYQSTFYKHILKKTLFSNNIYGQLDASMDSV